MNHYMIQNKTSLLHIGTYTGLTELHAYAACCRDAGYRVRVQNGELDFYGDETTKSICDINDVFITEMTK